MIQVQSHEIELVMQNTVERVNISITNEDGRPIDPTSLRLRILAPGDSMVLQDVAYPQATMRRNTWSYTLLQDLPIGSTMMAATDTTGIPASGFMSLGGTETVDFTLNGNGITFDTPTELDHPAGTIVTGPINPAGYSNHSASQLPARIERAGRGRYYFLYGLDNANGYPATYQSLNPVSAPWDISVNNQLRIAIDSKPFITITLTAVIPTNATAAEIVNSINAALVASSNYGERYDRTARYYAGEFFLTSPDRLVISKSKIQIDNTVMNSVVPVLWGLVPPTVIVNGNVGGVNPCIAALLSNRTQCYGDFLFHWEVEVAKGLERVSLLQVVKVASPKSFSVLPYFRLELDKALKEVGRDRARTGYTDAQLMGYLMLAVTEINSFQPITNLTVETFPTRNFMMILIYTATLIALYSQGLFSVDTDINYSDRGAAFQIDHSGKIERYITLLTSRLSQMMQQFKLQFADVGTVMYEAGANARLAELVNAAPPGALFRGLFSNGSSGV